MHHILSHAGSHVVLLPYATQHLKATNALLPVGNFSHARLSAVFVLKWISFDTDVYQT